MGNIISMKPKNDFLSHYRIAFDLEMGKRLAHARVQMGLKQSDLASLLGASQDHICRLELGKASVSTFSALAFHTVLRGRVNFVLFSDGADQYGYRTPEELIKIGKLYVKRVGG